MFPTQKKVNLLSSSVGLTLLVCVGLSLFGCEKAVQSRPSKLTQSVNQESRKKLSVEEKDYTLTSSGLKIKDEEVGSGAEAQAGKSVSVHYTGTFYPAGDKFDSSLDRGQPFQFKLGARQVIKGWDEGVAGMKIGGKRTLIIPPDLAYGPNGIPGAIPPNSTLKFEVELLGVN